MKRIHLFLCFIGCTVLSIAQNGIATLSLAHIEETHIQQSTVIQSDTVLALNYPETITGLSISGTATLNHTSNSLVRVTLQDDYNTEWLVYELFPLLADSSTVTFSNVAFETSVLENITAKQLNIKIINATLQLDGINTSNQTVASYSTLQNRAMEAQSSYIIDKLNENLEKRNIPWRAGETSVSRKTYEEKKAMFGGEVPNLGGFEYYKGGIFVMPDYELASNEGIATMSDTEEEDPYVKEWDWRNRHGKNWMTPVRNQEGCGACVAFSTSGCLEAYINLYFNQQLNIDLAEQELVSCIDKTTYTTDSTIINSCGSLNTFYTLKYIQDNGIVEEECFSYTGTINSCGNKCTNPVERIKINNYKRLYPTSENDLKKELFKNPIIADINSWEHSMILVGYKRLEENDTIWYMNDNNIETIKIVQNGDPFIGLLVWIFKNSWGDYWGSYDGFVYILTTLNDFNLYKIEGTIHCNTYTDENDFKIEDKDEDGYFTWGVRERPNTVPSWASHYQDGDDSNEEYGPLDEYGNLQRNELSSYPYYINGEYNIHNLHVNYGFVVKNEGKFVVTGYLGLHKDASIIVESGGELIINGGHINKANIILEPGAFLEIQNNGQITLKDSDSMTAKLGSTVNIISGSININTP